MNTKLRCIFFFVFVFFNLSQIDSTDLSYGFDFSKIKFDTGGLSRDAFAKGFVFGTATSAYQVEGMANKEGRGQSIWDPFVKIPGNIAGNATGDVAIDQYHKYKEDVDIMKRMNFDAYRFSISWPRIFPNGTGEVNWKGVAYYNRLINYMIDQGITPYANLYHYDLPLALQERYGGLLGKQIVKDFANFAEFCFDHFGDRVKNWMTFNEPRVIAALGFDNGINPPCRCSKEYGNCTEGNSGTEPYIAAHHIILAHAAAVNTYRTNFQKAQGGRIGILLDFVHYEPLTRGKKDNYAAQRARDFHLGWFLHPITYGKYPRTMQAIVKERLPKFSEEEVGLVKGSIDFLGINHYTSFYMFNPDSPHPPAPGYQNDWHAGFAYEKNGVPIGPRSHTFWLYQVPWGMYKVLMYVKERYGNPNVIVSENGRDTPDIQLPEALFDLERIEYFKTYLQNMKRAIDKGANVTGYFAWSLLDNFEWLSGYTSRFGIVYVDYKNDLKRYPKMSAHWFKQMLERKK
ncbi:beta-glucosidase 44-like [Cucurbita pepo subsp. pepo]|uniref:beta-glucosidase 44-like n=1 Tax=Cucurbita pepo subsp. pepo TaxID=3664 RepID=UPI000C9D48BE|nr:beta-glucosidase 44-like [Cucurbita pepo subsp. pepo]